MSLDYLIVQREREMETDTQSTGEKDGGGGYIRSKGMTAEGIIHGQRGREQFYYHVNL